MEPARKQNPDIQPDIRPNLGVIEGGGESTPERADLSEATRNSGQLAGTENKFGVLQGGGESNDDRANLKSVPDKEQDAGDAVKDQYGWNNRKQKSSDKQNKLFSRKNLKKSGGPLAVISGLGIVGTIFSGIFGFNTMIINILENMTGTNDSSTTVMQRRFLKTIGHMTGPTDPNCLNSKKIKCKMGRISNSALYKLEKKGIKADFGPDAKNTGKRTGYPSRNPTIYRVTMGDGSIKNIKAANFTGFLAANPGVASKVLGKGGAFSLRYKVWSGKYIAKRLYTPLGIKRDGGIADGNNEGGTRSERMAAIQEKMRSKIPGLETLLNADGGLKSKLDAKVTKQVNGAKKGGAAYTTAVAGCIALKAPGYVAAGVAAAQIAQSANVFMDNVGSAGSKAKASGVGSGFTSGDSEALGMLFTNETPRESDGKMSSALDSEILQQSMGVNKGRPGVPKVFAPGYSYLTSKFVRKSIEADRKTESACNGIMSKSAMYSAMAVDSAVTVAASATLIGGIFKAIVDWGASELAARALASVVDSYADDAITDIAKNDSLKKAEGEAFGDLVGTSAMTFYASGSMAHHIPVLKQSQLTAYENVRQESEQFNQAMDVASLSPFDTSSRYTFLGSLSRTFQTAMITSGGGGGYSFTSAFAGMANLSTAALNPKAGAKDGLTKKYCSYAEDWGLTTEDEANTPGITASGLPCTGYTDDQAAMDTSEVINDMIREGWIDENIEVSDDADIEELISSGVIKKDTPLFDFIEDCGNPASGDHIFNAASCTANSATKDSSQVDLKGNACSGEGEKRVCASDSTDYPDVEGIKNGRSLAALSPFLVDYQLVQSINGEDDEPDTAEAVAATGADTFTVATYNMCQELNHPDCPNRETKIQKIASVIEGTSELNSSQMDIIGAQELSQPTQKNLLSTLSGYDTYPKQVPENNGKAIIWNTAKFTKADGDSEAGLLLGVNGNGDSNSVDNNSFPWVRLTSTGGQSVYVMSVHSPNDGFGTPADRFENVQKILEWQTKKSSDGSLVILTGDFNNGAKVDGGNPGAYCYLTTGGLMQHASDMAQSKPAGTACPSDRVPIDQIYASLNIEGVTAKGWRHVGGSDSGDIAATDHSPAYVTFSTTKIGDNFGSGEVKMPLPAKMWNLYSSDFLNSHTYDSGTWTNGINRLASDISAPPDGTPVYAMVGGTVSNPNLGTEDEKHGLIIKSEIQGGILEIAYAHGPRANQNTTYAAGEEIMKVGALGNVTGGHLHIDMSFNGKGVCPQLVFAALGKNQTVNFADLAKISRAPC